MTTSIKIDHTHTGTLPHVCALCRFLSDYAALLLGCGATCIRLEKNVNRMAAVWNKQVEMTVLPRHIHMTVIDKSTDETFTFITAIPHVAISFDINTRLSRLSWAVADHRVSFDEARQIFLRIRHTSPAGKWWVLLAASAANAAFCRLFGGDLTAMAIVFAATLAGICLKQTLLEHKTDTRIIFIVCAFVSSVLGATDGLFSLGTTPDIAVGTSVLYLVPGIPFLNSFSDMLDGHYICAFGRFMNAVVLTCCLSIGLCGGMMLMHLGMF